MPPFRTNNENQPKTYKSIHGTFRVEPGERRWCPTNAEPRDPPVDPRNEEGNLSVNSKFENMTLETEVM